MRWASYRRIDDLDKNSFYFVLHSETSSVITTPNSLRGGGGGGGQCSGSARVCLIKSK